MRRILGEAAAKLGLIAEDFQNFLVRADTERTDQNRHGHLSCTVNLDIEDVIRVGFILQPGAAAGDNRACIKALAVLVAVNAIINSGRTHELGYNDTLGAVDHKRTCLRHNRKIRERNRLFPDRLLAGLVNQSCAHE